VGNFYYHIYTQGAEKGGSMIKSNLEVVGWAILTILLILSLNACCTGDECTDPEPYFPSRNYRTFFKYSTTYPFGKITDVSIQKEVRNKGGSGEIFITVECEKYEWYASKVFHMDKHESVNIKANFSVPKPQPQSFSCEFEFTVRAA